MDRNQKLMALGAVAILLVLMIVIVWYWRAPQENTLYDRLGGVYSIAAVIDSFSDAVVKNPVVGKDSPNPLLREWHKKQRDRLPGLKFMRTLWVCAVSGGPYKFVATKPGKCPFSLENAHAALQISPEEFDAVAQELSAALDRFNIPTREKGEVMAVFAAHKGEVNAGFFAVRGMTTSVVC